MTSLFNSPLLTRGQSEQMIYELTFVDHKSRQVSAMDLFSLANLPPLPEAKLQKSGTISGLEELVDLSMADAKSPGLYEKSPMTSPKITVTPAVENVPQPSRQNINVNLLRHLPQFFPVTADPSALALQSPKMDTTLQFTVNPCQVVPNLFQSSLTALVPHVEFSQNLFGINQALEPVGLGIPMDTPKKSPQIKHVFTPVDPELPRDLKPRRKKTTDEQLRELLQVFGYCDTPGWEIREELAKKTGMTNREVQIWFQNRRAKVCREARQGNVNSPSPSKASSVPSPQFTVVVSGKTF